MPPKVLFNSLVIGCSPSFTQQRNEGSLLPEEATATLRLIHAHAIQCAFPLHADQLGLCSYPDVGRQCIFRRLGRSVFSIAGVGK
jgi:hypothetical protein